MNRDGCPEVALDENMMAAPDTKMLKPCCSKNCSISLPVGRGSLGTGASEVLEVPSKLTQRAWSVYSGKRSFKTKGLEISLERFFQVCDCFFFGFTFAIGRNIRNTSSETTFFRVRNNFYSKVLHHKATIP